MLGGVSTRLLQYPAKPQSFPFQDTFITYIIKNATPEAQKNLMETCQYFLMKFPSSVCTTFVLDHSYPNIRFQKNSLYIHGSSLPLFLPPIRISGEFLCESYSTNIHLLIPKSYQCDAKEIRIRHQKLTFSDLKHLINPTRVTKLLLGSVEITENGGDNEIEVGRIIDLVPNAEDVEITLSPFGLNAQNLINLKRSAKFKHLHLEYLNDSISPEDFVGILQKHAAPKADIYINFSFEFQEFGRNFDREVRKLLKSWSSINERPLFHWWLNRNKCLCLKPEERCNQCQ